MAVEFVVEGEEDEGDAVNQFAPEILADGCVYFYPDLASFCEEHGFQALQFRDGQLFGLGEDNRWRNVESDAKQPASIKRIQ